MLVLRTVLRSSGRAANALSYCAISAQSLQGAGRSAALQAYASLPRLTPLTGRSDCLLALVLTRQNIKTPF